MENETVIRTTKRYTYVIIALTALAGGLIGYYIGAPTKYEMERTEILGFTTAWIKHVEGNLTANERDINNVINRYGFTSKELMANPAELSKRGIVTKDMRK